MYLIATDEAGYGPKLGPLVVVGTAWRMPDNRVSQRAVANERAAATQPFPSQETLNENFKTLAQPVLLDGRRLTVDDSKRVYRRGDGLGMLHAIVTAGLQWCGNLERSYPALLSEICREDYDAILQTPWLSSGTTTPPIESDLTKAAIAHWSASGISLVAVQARVITARSFNDTITSGRNKADLLSQSTLEIVRNLVDQFSADGSLMKVCCDRHGGRRYYAGPLQHEFSDRTLRVVSESKDLSRYQLSKEDQKMEIEFTVKGDRFPPVAFSSLVAKYLREQFMESLNAYFRSRLPNGVHLQPTAGYPVDADRFLKQIDEIRKQEKITDHNFVRCR